MIPDGYEPKVAEWFRILKPCKGSGWSYGHDLEVPAGSEGSLDEVYGDVYCLEVDTEDQVIEVYVNKKDLEPI